MSHMWACVCDYVALLTVMHYDSEWGTTSINNRVATKISRDEIQKKINWTQLKTNVTIQQQKNTHTE